MKSNLINLKGRIICNDLNIPVVRVSITLLCQTVERKRR